VRGALGSVCGAAGSSAGKWSGQIRRRPAIGLADDERAVVVIHLSRAVRCVASQTRAEVSVAGGRRALGVIRSLSSAPAAPARRGGGWSQPGARCGMASLVWERVTAGGVRTWRNPSTVARASSHRAEGVVQNHLSRAVRYGVITWVEAHSGRSARAHRGVRPQTTVQATPAR